MCIPCCVNRSGAHRRHNIFWPRQDLLRRGAPRTFITTGGEQLQLLTTRYVTSRTIFLPFGAPPHYGRKRELQLGSTLRKTLTHSLTHTFLSFDTRRFCFGLVVRSVRLRSRLCCRSLDYNGDNCCHFRFLFSLNFHTR